MKATRRRWIEAATAAALLAAVPPLFRNGYGDLTIVRLARQLIPDHAAAGRLARRYRAVVAPRDLAADVKRLDRLARRAGRTEVARAHLKSAVKRDFQSGNSCIVDGWVMARTELTLCASADKLS